MLQKRSDLIQKVHLEIEKIVEETGISYLDASLKYIEENDLEMETIAKLIKQNKTLKEKMQEECENLNLVERGKNNKLPLT